MKSDEARIYLPWILCLCFALVVYRACKVGTQVSSVERDGAQKCDTGLPEPAASTISDEGIFSVPFFTTTIPLYPTGSSRLRHLIDSYSESLTPHIVHLEARLTVLRTFIQERNIDESYHHRSVVAARRIEAALVSRISRTAALWDINMRALEIICKPFSAVVALANLAEEIRGTTDVKVKLRYEDGGKGESATAFILVPPSQRLQPAQPLSSKSEPNGSAVRESASRSAAGSYDAPYQVIAHTSRDWSSDGVSSRQELYGPILAFLDRMKSPRSEVRVLVPGSGTGRLAWELAVQGFNVHANDVSFGMLAVSAAMMRCRGTNTTAGTLLQDETGGGEGGDDDDDGRIEMYPYLHHGDTNTGDSARRHRSVRVPDVFPAQASPESLRRLSFQHGDFTSIYRSSAFESHFDIVVTCFFLDTAANVIKYMEVLWHVLKEGGLWINHGPVQWHADNAVMISLDEMMNCLVDFGFVVEEVKRTRVSYGVDLVGAAAAAGKEEGGESRPRFLYHGSTRPDPYRPIFFGARRGPD